MKLDLSILEQLDIDPHESREPVYAMRVSDMLVMLKEDADRIIARSDRFFSTEDADVQADCIDIVSARLNDYVQVFMEKEHIMGDLIH